MNTTNKTAVEERVWVFVAYSNGIPYFSKLFTDHTEMKLFSAEHEKVEGYSSDYFDLTDTCLLQLAHQQGEREERSKIIGEMQAVGLFYPKASKIVMQSILTAEELEALQPEPLVGKE